MFLYIDSLFGDGQQREAKPLHTIPETLTGLYLLAMREHDRAGVFLHGSADRWEPMPDWRFDRQVIRTALYAKERLGVKAGQGVAIVSELRPEWFLVDFAAAGLGAVSIAVPPNLSPRGLAATLEHANPDAVFFSGRVRESLQAVAGGLLDKRGWVCFDGSPEGEAVDFAQLVELGGTLDTPERAQVFRAGARDAEPDELVIRHYVEPGDTHPIHVDLTHREVVERLKASWAENPPQQGDLVYVASPEVSLDLRLIVYAYMGDGYSTVALGNPGAEAREIRTLQPQSIVASSKAIEALIDDQRARSHEQAAQRVTGWRRLRARLSRQPGPSRDQQTVIEALGGRARWIGPTNPLDPALSALLSSAVAVGSLGAAAAQPA